MCDKNCVTGFLAYAGIFFASTTWLYAIGCGSVLANVFAGGKWRVPYERIFEGEASTLFSLFRDYSVNPFVDAIVTSSPTCPASHPEDFVYDMWPGTVGLCDCLSVDNPLMDKSYKYEECAEKGGCASRPGIAPIIQNRFRGLRYCGRRSNYSLKETFRPVKQDDGSFACPDGLEPCSKAYLDVPGGEEFAVCFSDAILGMERASVCPITSVAFSYKDIEGDKDNFEIRQGVGQEAKDESIWVSYDIV